MQAKLPTLSQCFKRLESYLDKTSRISYSHQWNKQEAKNVLSLLGFEPWLEVTTLPEANKTIAPINQVWLHPRGLYAVMGSSDDFVLTALTSNYMSNWMTSFRSSAAIAIEHGYEIKTMSFRVNSFKVLEDLLSDRVFLDEVLPLKSWTMLLLKNLEEDVIFSEDSPKKDGHLKEFRAALRAIAILDKSHSLNKLVVKYINKFGDAPHVSSFNDDKVLLSEQVNHVLKNELFYYGDFFKKLNALERKNLRFLSEFLTGTSSTSWQKVNEFCHDQNISSHPLLLCIDLIDRLRSKKFDKLEKHIQNVLLPQVEKICQTLTEKEFKEVWECGGWNQTKLHDGLFNNIESLNGLSMLLSKMRGRINLSFINDKSFDFENVRNHNYVVSQNNVSEEKIFNFFKNNPEFLKQESSENNNLNLFLDDFNVFVESDASHLLLNTVSKIYKENKLRESFILNTSSTKLKSIRF